MLRQTDFENFYRRHAPAVFRRARHVLGDEAEANEVVQDLFMSLFEAPDQFAQRSSWTTYLYQATTHACLNRLRDERNRARLRLERGAELVPGSPSSTTHLAENRLLLTTLLERMPEDLAQLAVYHHLDGLTQDETAALMNCSRRHIVNLLERLANWSQAQRAQEDKPPGTIPIVSKERPNV